MAGRGRLSSLDLLPEEAQDDLVWAMAQLNERKRTQADILFELNDRLEAKGIDTISSSAFGRKAVRLAKRNQRLDERRHLYAGIAPKLTADKIAEDDLVLAEFIKSLLDELLEEEGHGTKNALDLAKAYQAVVSAQAQSAKNRAFANDEAKKKLTEAIDKAEAAVTSGKGDPAEVLRRIREDVYGIFER